MIDFQSGGLFARLGPSDPRELAAELAPSWSTASWFSSVSGDQRLRRLYEQAPHRHQRPRPDWQKRDYSSLPYSKIQAWSVETAGRFDLDAELELWFSGLGKVRLEFKGQVDIRSIGRLIGSYVL